MHFNKMNSLLPGITLAFLIGTEGFVGIKFPGENGLEPTSTVTFASAAESYLQLNFTWPITAQRAVELRFRTHQSNGLLLYEELKGFSRDLYCFHLEIIRGQLKVSAVTPASGEPITLIAGKGLHDNRWHSVLVKVDFHSNEIHATVDETHVATVAPPSVKSFSMASTAAPISIVFLGGLIRSESYEMLRQIGPKFTGCVDGVQFLSGGKEIKDLEGHPSKGVLSGCIDRCRYESSCALKEQCVNMYTHTDCDCLGSGFTGETCEKRDKGMLTLRGHSLINHKLYSWKEKAASAHHRFSIKFRTHYDNSILFYGQGVQTGQYLYVSLRHGSVKVVVAIARNEREVSAQVGKRLNDNWWHTVTVTQSGNKVLVKLDRQVNATEIAIPSSDHYLNLDPDVYIGGLPDNHPMPVTRPQEFNFVGTIESVYVGRTDLLHALKNGNKDTVYVGDFAPEFGYSEVNVMPITFPFATSYIVLQWFHKDYLDLTLEFKTRLLNCVIANGFVKSAEHQGYWQIEIREGAALLKVEVMGTPLVAIVNGKELNNNAWHQLRIEIESGKATLTVDYYNVIAATLEENTSIQFGSDIVVGSSKSNSHSGFVGCLRDIIQDGQTVDPRGILDTGDGLVTLDDCSVVNLCDNPHACEHGGRCSVVDERVRCDCAETGYTGKKCSFPSFMSSCAELLSKGQDKSGTYLVDPDGYGPYPPVPVHCVFSAGDRPVTRIAHDVPEQFVVRKPEERNVAFNVTYRNYTTAMLHDLVYSSTDCWQDIRYDCLRAPIQMGINTWFETAFPSKKQLLTLHGETAGACPCSAFKSCVNPKTVCNCDANTAQWQYDATTLGMEAGLPVTRMFFKHANAMSVYTDTDVSGRITLGELSCSQEKVSLYVIAVKSSDAQLAIEDGWTGEGDIQFAFRTTDSRGVLLYQASPNELGYFAVLIRNTNALTIEYGQKYAVTIKVVARQSVPLNDGRWQSVRVSYSHHQIRVTLNSLDQYFDVEEHDVFGPFEGELYIGGLPIQDQLPLSLRKERGFVGCFSDLRYNGRVPNLTDILPSSNTGVSSGCSSSCESNPCRNGGKCVEHWGSYRCECANPLIHTGVHCENNVNQDGLSFVHLESHYFRLYQGDIAEPRRFLSEDISMTLRSFANSGVILFAHDHFNNFVLLHIDGGNKLVFTFNSDREIAKVFVVHPGWSNGKPKKLTITRSADKTTMTVDDLPPVAVNKPTRLLDTYYREPWLVNGDLELVKPSRPPVGPRDYMQVFIGDLDHINVQSDLTGYLGCLIGFKLGAKLFDVGTLQAYEGDHPGADGLRDGCVVPCDAGPCLNQGKCTDNFIEATYNCSCTAEFSGDHCQTVVHIDVVEQDTSDAKYSDRIAVSQQNSFLVNDHWAPPPPVLEHFEVDTISDFDKRIREMMDAQYLAKRVGLILGFCLFVTIFLMAIYVYRVDAKNQRYKMEGEGGTFGSTESFSAAHKYTPLFSTTAPEPNVQVHSNPDSPKYTRENRVNSTTEVQSSNPNLNTYSIPDVAQGTPNSAATNGQQQLLVHLLDGDAPAAPRLVSVEQELAWEPRPDPADLITPSMDDVSDMQQKPWEVAADSDNWRQSYPAGGTGTNMRSFKPLLRQEAPIGTASEVTLPRGSIVMTNHN